MPQRRRKRLRLGDTMVPDERLRAQAPDHVWALDFQFDQTADGRILKLLHVVDEFTREALAIECHRRIDADKTVATLEWLVAERRTAPGFIRCDNGPELTANALRDWCRFSRAGNAYIEPGSPWQNPYVESFGSRLPDELLAVELFSCLPEAQVLMEDWRLDYNEHRPHPALGMMTPTAFGAGYRTAHQAAGEHLSPPGGTEQWLAGTKSTTNCSHSRWTDEWGPINPPVFGAAGGNQVYRFRTRLRSYQPLALHVFLESVACVDDEGVNRWHNGPRNQQRECGRWRAIRYLQKHTVPSRSDCTLNRRMLK